MPVFNSFKKADLSLAVWEITEEPERLEDFLNLQLEPEIHTNPIRNTQWLACRAALQTVLPNANSKVYKDEFGKPHVEGELHISLSHTKRFATAVVAQNQVGVDIEEISPRIQRIAKRFLHSKEMDFVKNLDNLQMLYLIWCAKEAMFKLYGKKSVDFAEHMRVMPFELKEKGTFEIQFLKEQTSRYCAEYQIFENHALVWVMS